MQLETFRGPDLRTVIAGIQEALGADAMIVRTNVIKRPEGDVFEVLAAPPERLAEYRDSLAVGPVSQRMAERPAVRPYVIALVGPPGAGKTTAAMKLALHPRGVGGRRVGLITLDTYRVGAVEEAQAYAEVAGLPLEVVYHLREVPAAMARLSSAEVVIVDTPGRNADGAGWFHALKRLEADEVHLVVPASLRSDLAAEAKRRMEPVGITHALFTKLDEVPGDVGLTDIANALGLPIRWVGDGYEVPGRLSPAGTRLVRALGKTAGPAPVFSALA